MGTNRWPSVGNDRRLLGRHDGCGGGIFDRDCSRDVRTGLRGIRSNGRDFVWADIRNGVVACGGGIYWKLPHSDVAASVEFAWNLHSVHRVRSGRGRLAAGGVCGVDAPTVSVEL